MFLGLKNNYIVNLNSPFEGVLQEWAQGLESANRDKESGRNQTKRTVGESTLLYRYKLGISVGIRQHIKKKTTTYFLFECS